MRRSVIIWKCRTHKNHANTIKNHRRRSTNTSTGVIHLAFSCRRPHFSDSVCYLCVFKCLLIIIKKQQEVRPTSCQSLYKFTHCIYTLYIKPFHFPAVVGYYCRKMKRFNILVAYVCTLNDVEQIFKVTETVIYFNLVNSLVSLIL